MGLNGFQKLEISRFPAVGALQPSSFRRKSARPVLRDQGMDILFRKKEERVFYRSSSTVSTGFRHFFCLFWPVSSLPESPRFPRIYNFHNPRALPPHSIPSGKKVETRVAARRVASTQTTQHRLSAPFSPSREGMTYGTSREPLIYYIGRRPLLRHTNNAGFCKGLSPHVFRCQRKPEISSEIHGNPGPNCKRKSTEKTVATAQSPAATVLGKTDSCSLSAPATGAALRSFP
jgi:hypothetical protein